MGLTLLYTGIIYVKAVLLLHRPAAQLESFVCSKPPSGTLHQFGRGAMANCAGVCATGHGRSVHAASSIAQPGQGAWQPQPIDCRGHKRGLC